MLPYSESYLAQVQRNNFKPRVEDIFTFRVHTFSNFVLRIMYFLFSRLCTYCRHKPTVPQPITLQSQKHMFIFYFPSKLFPHFSLLTKLVASKNCLSYPEI
jgi:hypothetical protein